MSTKYRFHKPEAAYFISFATVNWVDIFTREIYFEVLIDSIKYCRKNKGLELFCYCIMPNHVHMIFRSKNEDPSGDFIYGSGENVGQYMHGPDLEHVEDIPIKLRYNCELTPDGTWVMTDVTGRQKTVNESISEDRDRKKSEKENKKKQKEDKKKEKKTKKQKVIGRSGNPFILQ